MFNICRSSHFNRLILESVSMTSRTNDLDRWWIVLNIHLRLILRISIMDDLSISLPVNWTLSLIKWIDSRSVHFNDDPFDAVREYVMDDNSFTISADRWFHIGLQRSILLSHVFPFYVVIYWIGHWCLMGLWWLNLITKWIQQIVCSWANGLPISYNCSDDDLSIIPLVIVVIFGAYCWLSLSMTMLFISSAFLVFRYRSFNDGWSNLVS